MADFKKEIERRRTFAIISHPDAGKTTLTEKLLLQKRFEERLGQRETARALGVSQMQVSRMERRLLTRLREKMTTAVQ